MTTIFLISSQASPSVSARLNSHIVHPRPGQFTTVYLLFPWNRDVISQQSSESWLLHGSMWDQLPVWGGARRILGLSSSSATRTSAQKYSTRKVLCGDGVVGGGERQRLLNVGALINQQGLSIRCRACSCFRPLRSPPVCRCFDSRDRWRYCK